MAISLASLRQSSSLTPPRILIHGVAGVGKSTFAANADSPVVIATEDGLGMLKVASFPVARSFDEVMEGLAALYSESHEFRTVVVDSVDWLEPLIWKKACDDNRWGSIEEPGYGKGYLAALDLWRQYLDGLNALRDERRMTVIQIAHTDIKRFDSPEHEPYDRYLDPSSRLVLDLFVQVGARKLPPDALPPKASVGAAIIARFRNIEELPLFKQTTAIEQLEKLVEQDGSFVHRDFNAKRGPADELRPQAGRFYERPPPPDRGRHLRRRR